MVPGAAPARQKYHEGAAPTSEQIVGQDVLEERLGGPLAAKMQFLLMGEELFGRVSPTSWVRYPDEASADIEA